MMLRMLNNRKYNKYIQEVEDCKTLQLTKKVENYLLVPYSIISPPGFIF